MLKGGKQEVQFANPPLQQVVKELRDGLLSQKLGASAAAQEDQRPLERHKLLCTRYFSQPMRQIRSPYLYTYPSSLGSANYAEYMLN